MKVRSNLTAVMLAALALGVSASAGAAQKGTHKGQSTAAAAASSAAAVDALHTAELLARYGDANKDPLALIEAARIVKDAGATTDSKAKQTAGKPGDAKNKPDTMSVASLVERAKALAGGRADLIALADDVSKSSSRGGVNGPGYRQTVVRSRAYDDFIVTFRGGEPARVAVRGDGDSDLDLYVYDENGNLICKDDDPSDGMYCAWNPRWTGPFRIRILNRGVANEYRIAHN